MAGTHEITAADLNNVADKIDSLELSVAERAVVETILARAAATEGDVEGFASGFTATDDLWKLKIEGDGTGTSPGGRRVGQASGLIIWIPGHEK